MDPITSVMRVMTDAVSNVKLATLSMAAFRQARPRGEEEGMEAAIGRAADALPSAIQSAQASQAALVRAQAEVQAQESLSWQQLKDEAEAAARVRARAKVRQALQKVREMDTEGGGRDSREDSSAQPDERRAQPKAAGPGGAPPSGANPPDKGENPSDKGVVYTHLGGVKPKSKDKKLSVTA
jgi:hypothetical protein